MSARENILNRLRATGERPIVSEPDVSGWYAHHRPEVPEAPLIDQLCRQLQAAHAEVHRVDQRWPVLLHELLVAKKVTRLLLAKNLPHGLHTRSEFDSSGIDCCGYEQAIEAWKDALFTEAHAALTTARCAISETGTLVLWPTPDEPRSMSLVPPIHIVLLDARKIHATFFAALQAEGWQRGLPTNVVLISGPSKTADIQQTLAYGAHGPRELIVLVQEDQP